MNIFKIIAISLLLVIASFDLSSQNNWTLSMTGFDQTYSPSDFTTSNNGDVFVNGVKYDNGKAGFINKLYKSTNQGASWAEISTTGLANLGNVHSLTISNGKMILGGMDVVSANGGKIFTSSDNGASWIISMTGFDQTYSPSDFATAINGDIFVNGVKYDSGKAGFINKLYKSTNQGASWAEINTTGLANLGNVHSLTISNGKMILAGMDIVSTNGAKIYISSDNGASWTLSMTGFDQTYSPSDFTTAINGDIFVNGVKYDNGKAGFINKLYKSTNQGASWAEISTTGLANLGNVNSLTISNGKMILGGMDIVSSNGGKIFISDLGTQTNIQTSSLSSKDIRYFPNPFDSNLTLHFNQVINNPKSLKIISITGKEVFKLNDIPSVCTLSLNTETFESGIYILILEFTNGINTYKLQKK